MQSGVRSVRGLFRATALALMAAAAMPSRAAAVDTGPSTSCEDADSHARAAYGETVRLWLATHPGREAETVVAPSPLIANVAQLACQFGVWRWYAQSYCGEPLDLVDLAKEAADNDRYGVKDATLALLEAAENWGEELGSRRTGWQFANAPLVDMRTRSNCRVGARHLPHVFKDLVNAIKRLPAHGY